MEIRMVTNTELTTHTLPIKEADFEPENESYLIDDIRHAFFLGKDIEELKE